MSFSLWSSRVFERVALFGEEEEEEVEEEEEKKKDARRL